MEGKKMIEVFKIIEETIPPCLSLKKDCNLSLFIRNIDEKELLKFAKQEGLGVMDSSDQEDSYKIVVKDFKKGEGWINYYLSGQSKEEVESEL